MNNYCTECGKKSKRHKFFDLANLCRECSDKRHKENVEEQRNQKLKESNTKKKIAKDFKIDKKIRELEQIVGKPCMLELRVASNGVYLFGRFVRRKFTVKPLSKERKIKLLEGNYKDIDDFCKKAKKVGFNVDRWSADDVSLFDKNKRYNFVADGIYNDIGRAGPFARISSGKVAEVKFELWRS